ncbi:ThiF family adenylyltransferase [Nocardiopsis sp. ATB16-24]|uniref:ThiF family adenylyltransferase n=1 Tax=Nocardiopsis sp. ATB16-24 TaxID=3019555 RepID=UPI00255741DD|nr:ThiF family adenylyltransferase [Nocardiopsis sp. ATB16-24]
MKLWLPPYLSIRECDGGLRIGTLPPVAWQLEEPPEFLLPFLRRCAQPTEREQLVGTAAELSGWTRDESIAMIADLEEARVLVPAPEGRGRYDRHGLFYQLMGIDDGAQKHLSEVSVGLIGMGGIGTHLATHLTAAGVGRLVVTDGDEVELSNLTRQTLFTESDVGRLKVEVAAERLRALRADLDVVALPESFSSADLAVRVAEQADLVLLSADRPADVHLWTSRACEVVGIPFSASGYIEGHGSVGPLLLPPETPCFSCIRAEAERLPDTEGRRSGETTAETTAHELNPHWQAPSFGPLNALVAAAQANEALRWLLGLPVATKGHRMLIDSRTYDPHWEEFGKGGTGCSVCGTKEASGWGGIASQYAEERESHSFNAVLLDPLVPELAAPAPGMLIADVGAGAGQVTSRLAALGACVEAYEPDSAMRELLRRHVRDHGDLVRVLPQGLEALSGAEGRYDTICCLNVLDHIADLPKSVRLLHGALKPGGRLVLSIPHPMKDRGGWHKLPGPHGWEYRHYVVDDYFREGECLKDREDRNGEVKMRGVRTYHRTLSRYFEEFLDQGFLVRRVLEPHPEASVREEDPVIFDKASRIPYFAVLVMERSADA